MMKSTPDREALGEVAIARLRLARRTTAVSTLPSLARSALVMSSASSCGPVGALRVLRADGEGVALGVVMFCRRLRLRLGGRIADGAMPATRTASGTSASAPS
jgi:hypothetical protein